jgi:nitroimidazol reductase NimA-like FMN-containing flavoprotein (pyridoxamine 5'-phosphate oxidase superfamily)
VTEQPRAQRRGRKIAMTPDERDAFLAERRTCRVATIGPDGPHATPLWFLWERGCLWLYSITRSQRWADLQRDPRISATIDTGHEFLELRGVEITGTVEVVGEVPRTGEPHDELAALEKLFFAKYFPDMDIFHDGRHAWLKLIPRKIASWDFRKIGQ